MRRDPGRRDTAERPRREQGGRSGLAVRPLPRRARGRRPVAQHRRPRARPRQGGRDVGGVPAGTRGTRGRQALRRRRQDRRAGRNGHREDGAGHPRRTPAGRGSGPDGRGGEGAGRPEKLPDLRKHQEQEPAAQHPAGIVPRLRGVGRPVRRSPAEAHGIPRRGLVGGRRRAPQGGGAHARGGAARSRPSSARRPPRQGRTRRPSPPRTGR